MLANDEYSEAYYESSGRRTEPVLRYLALDCLPVCEWPLLSDDVLVVTGGGKGIAAECALALAREHGTRVAVLGRTQLEQDVKLRDNLKRFKAHSRVHYFVADITNAEQVRSTVKEIEQKFGKITALLHGAAVNVPSPLRSLSKSTFISTIAPKVQGAFNLLEKEASTLPLHGPRMVNLVGAGHGRTPWDNRYTEAEWNTSN
jgi:enediyne polyketide synthase